MREFHAVPCQRYGCRLTTYEDDRVCVVCRNNDLARASRPARSDDPVSPHPGTGSKPDATWNASVGGSRRWDDATAPASSTGVLS